MEIITLTNGKRVANFSSAHHFVFTDGSILPALSEDDAKKYKVTFIEKIDPNNGDVELTFSISQDINDLMHEWQALYDSNEVDVVFCPLPMITAMKEHSHWRHIIKDSPFRSIRREDRCDGLVSINKQCL